VAKAAKTPPPEVEVADPEGALRRLADLTRRVIAVPKDEVPPLFSKLKKRRKAKPKRGSKRHGE
jgi:hypothetical protein